MQQQELDRFNERDVATGAVIGLDQKGWERGRPQDGGMICDYWRHSSGGLRVSIGFGPGIFVGGGIHEARQSLGTLWCTRSVEGTPEAPACFSELDPIIISEVLRDIDLLNPALATPTP